MESKLVLNDLIESKIYVRNNISYMEPKAVIEPFLENLDYSNENLRIEVQNPVINQNVSGEENIAYPRFLIEMRKGEVLFDDYIGRWASQSIGILKEMPEGFEVIKPDFKE